MGRIAVSSTWVTAVAALIILSVVGFSMSALAQSDNVIVPGVRVGPVAIGMSPDQVAQVFGSPSRRQIEGNPPVNIIHHYPDLMVSYRAGVAPRVFSLYTQSSRWVTDKGIRVGNSGSSVPQAHGAPLREECGTGTRDSSCTAFYRGLLISVVLSSSRVVGFVVQGD